MKTLLIVDVQNDFMPGGALPVPNGDEILPVINKIQEHFELVVATQDWHPPDHLSFASAHEGKMPFDDIDLGGLKQTLWPGHCVQGTVGAEFHHSLDINKTEAVIRKGMEREIDSYSGFFDNGRKKKTGLAGYLRERECDELYLCGLAADICVYYTIIDALKEGFTANLIIDATQPLDRDHFSNLQRKMENEGVRLIKSDQLSKAKQ